jgi:hypothetical protein
LRDAGAESRIGIGYKRAVTAGPMTGLVDPYSQTGCRIAFRMTTDPRLIEHIAKNLNKASISGFFSKLLELTRDDDG